MSSTPRRLKRINDAHAQATIGKVLREGKKDRAQKEREKQPSISPWIVWTLLALLGGSTVLGLVSHFLF